MKEEVGVCAGKNSFERDYENCLPKRSTKDLRAYASVCFTQNLALYVLISYSETSALHVCVSNQLFQTTSERYDDIRERLMKLFHHCISTLRKESESVAHTRRTNTPTKEQHERPHVINGIVLRERERERITLSERACDDDDDAKCIRVRSSMRFDDLFVGEAEGNNNNNIDENESY